ncbi:hypothetical protein KM043_009588 [Ampulex compressa]|nr:hypothetical protein KM043_009588 [Ampulex compressa]
MKQRTVDGEKRRELYLSDADVRGSVLVERGVEHEAVARVAALTTVMHRGQLTSKMAAMSLGVAAPRNKARFIRAPRTFPPRLAYENDIHSRERSPCFGLHFHIGHPLAHPRYRSARPVPRVHVAAILGFSFHLPRTVHPSQTPPLCIHLSFSYSPPNTGIDAIRLPAFRQNFTDKPLMLLYFGCNELYFLRFFLRSSIIKILFS